MRLQRTKVEPRWNCRPRLKAFYGTTTGLGESGEAWQVISVPLRAAAVDRKLSSIAVIVALDEQ